MIDDLSAARPQSGLSSASVVWQAPAEGGIPRYMAIFQDTHAEEHRAGPQLALLLHRLGRRVAGDLRPRRRVAAGARDAPRQGQRPVRLQRRRVPLQRDLLPAHDALLAAQPVHDRARSCAASGKRIGAKDKAYKPVWKFAPDAPLDARPYGGTITVKYPYNTISYKYDRKTNTYLRSVTGEKKQTDAGNGDADRAEERRRHADALRSAQRRPSRSAAPRGRRRRQRAGLDLDQRPDDQGHLEEDRDHQADPVLRRERATKSR